jgi:hypothetical protein
MQFVALSAMALAAWPSPLRPTIVARTQAVGLMPTRCSVASFRAQLGDGDDDTTQTDGEADREKFNDFVRSGGFIDNRPPDDIDKLATFSFQEVPLEGQILIATGVILTLTLAIFLIVV